MIHKADLSKTYHDFLR